MSFLCRAFEVAGAVSICVVIKANAQESFCPMLVSFHSAKQKRARGHATWQSQTFIHTT